MKVVYRVLPGRGWDTVTHMVHLAARLLSAELVLLGDSKTDDAMRELASLRAAETKDRQLPRCCRTPRVTCGAP